MAKRANVFNDMALVTVTVTMDRGALRALKDSPHMLQPDREGANYANAVRRGVKALAEAQVTEHE